MFADFGRSFEFIIRQEASIDITGSGKEEDSHFSRFLSLYSSELFLLSIMRFFALIGQPLL